MTCCKETLIEEERKRRHPLLLHTFFFFHCEFLNHPHAEVFVVLGNKAARHLGKSCVVWSIADLDGRWRTFSGLDSPEPCAECNQQPPPHSSSQWQPARSQVSSNERMRSCGEKKRKTMKRSAPPSFHSGHCSQKISICKIKQMNKEIDRRHTACQLGS